MEHKKRKELIEKLETRFHNEDIIEPFNDRFYVFECKRIYNLLKKSIGDCNNATELAWFDITHEIIDKLSK